jgi:hypothetical protein
VTGFRKAALIFVTASTGHGWHHMDVHQKSWWIRKYESYGFEYDETLTNEAREIAKINKKKFTGPHIVYLDGFYIRATLIVFVNPFVAALPEYAHLLMLWRKKRQGRKDFSPMQKRKRRIRSRRVDESVESDGRHGPKMDRVARAPGQAFKKSYCEKGLRW